MKYNVVVADFDGTLLRSDKTLEQRTIDTIRAFQEKGGKFYISTGRAPDSILPPARGLGLSGQVMCCQGSVVCDIQTGKVLSCYGYPWEKAYELVKTLEDEGRDLILFSGGKTYVERSAPVFDLYIDAAGVVPEPIGKLSDFIARTKQPMNKLLSTQKYEKTEEYYAKDKDRFTGVAVCISEPYLEEFADVNFNKGTSLTALRKTLPEGSKIITFGDSMIDSTLIECGDLGVAVGNARQEVKDIADLVTVTNDEDAVGYIIRKYCLEEEDYE